MERTNCASRADQTRHSAACAKAFLLALACAPRQADQGAGPRPGTEAERLVQPCRPRLSAAAPPPIHRGLAYRALHHRARRCPRAVSCASHERRAIAARAHPAALQPSRCRRRRSARRVAPPACTRERAGGPHGAGWQRSRVRHGLARARSPPHAARTAGRRARRLAQRRHSSRKRIALGRSAHGRSRA